MKIQDALANPAVLAPGSNITIDQPAPGDPVTISSTASGGGGSSAEPNVQAADYTLVLDDAGKVIEFDAATGSVLTVPPNADVALPIGSLVGVYQAGVGGVQIAAGAGVTIRNLADLAGQYAEASLRKRATDEWVLAGDLTTAAGITLKDYAEATRTAGDVTLNQTAVTAVNTGLDLVLAAEAGDLIEFGITGSLEAIASAPVCFDVYTVPSGSTVNPFGAGLSASLASAQGIPGWSTGNSATALASQLSGAVSRVLTAADVAAGNTTLRLLYAKTNTTPRRVFAQTNLPLKVWAKNYGQV